MCSIQKGMHTFCNYVEYNCNSEQQCFKVNSKVLDLVTGAFGALEVINSGSVFEFDGKTMAKIKEVCTQKNITLLYFESQFGYKDRLSEIRDYFDVKIIFKCEIETFDDYFRNKVLKKGIIFESPAQVAKYFESICLMVGVQGQMKEMIAKDIEILIK